MVNHHVLGGEMSPGTSWDLWLGGSLTETDHPRGRFSVGLPAWEDRHPPKLLIIMCPGSGWDTIWGGPSSQGFIKQVLCIG